MRKFSILLTATALLAATACGSGSGSSDSPAVDTSVPAKAMADSMATHITPEQSAERFVEWVKNIDRADVAYAARLAKELGSSYGTGARRFNTAVDSITGTLSLKEQARIFTTVSNPSALGRAVKADPDADKIAPLIIDFYGADSASVNSFRAGMK